MTAYTAAATAEAVRPPFCELSRSSLRLAVFDLLSASPKPSLAEIQARLGREAADHVADIYDELSTAGAGYGGGSGQHGLRAERMRELHRPLRTERRNLRGVPITEMAGMICVGRETLCALLEHHGYVETAYYGGRQRRRLLTRSSIKAGIGQNIDPTKRRSVVLDGSAKAAPFVVFWPEYVDKVIWTLDLDRIRGGAAAITERCVRAEWLIHHHGYLPGNFLAHLCGYSERGWKKLAQRVRAAAVQTPFTIAA